MAEREPRKHFGLILLAAGGSRRMGQPKQKLPIAGMPMVLRAVRAALQSAAWPIVVVLGHEANELRRILAAEPVLIVENKNWERGIGSSLKAGLQTLQNFSLLLEGCVIALADQPHLAPALINQLAHAQSQPEQISAARYAGVVGAPVYLPRGYFTEALTLADDEGAQRLLKKYSAQVIPIDAPELAIDLDTPEDYRRYITTGS